MVTLWLESGKYIRFQVDTGARCNILPLLTYKRATNDYKLAQVDPASTTITAYGGTTLSVIGRVRKEVWRGTYHCKLDCLLVDSTRIHPLLERKACIGMHIVSYIDNDSINPPSPRTRQETVLAISAPGTSVISKENLLTNYSTVFSEGVGKLEGEYHIRLDMKIEPVQQAPRRVPVALREPLKRTLDILVEQDILAPVTKPKAWISSIVVVPKSNGLLHICLDPKDLNKAILREHYPLPTIEEVAT